MARFGTYQTDERDFVGFGQPEICTWRRVMQRENEKRPPGLDTGRPSSAIAGSKPAPVPSR